MSADGKHEVSLTLPARPENLAVVRQAVAGVAVANGAAPDRVDDIKTAVTEACMNAVVHAYPERDEAGPLEVTFAIEGSRMIVCVRDFGTGIQPTPVGHGASGLRLGLPLIGALADAVELSAGKAEGTMVRIAFDLVPSQVESPPEREPPVQSAETLIASTNGGADAIGPTLSILAARLGFSVDRLSDLHLLGDVLASSVSGEHEGGPFDIAIEETEAALVLRVGPLGGGDANRILERANLPGMGNALERIANGIEVQELGDGKELLVLEMNRAR